MITDWSCSLIEKNNNQLIKQKAVSENDFTLKKIIICHSFEGENIYRPHGVVQRSTAVSLTNDEIVTLTLEMEPICLSLLIRTSEIKKK